MGDDLVDALQLFLQGGQLFPRLVDNVGRGALDEVRVGQLFLADGDLTAELARRVGPFGEVVGCDFSEPMLDRARIKSPEIRFDWADALDLPYETREFDAVTRGFALRHLADTGKGLSEMAAGLQPGGGRDVTFGRPAGRPAVLSALAGTTEHAAALRILVPEAAVTNGS